MVVATEKKPAIAPQEGEEAVATDVEIKRHLTKIISGAIRGTMKDHNLRTLPMELAGSVAKRAVGQICKTVLMVDMNTEGIFGEETKETFLKVPPT